MIKKHTRIIAICSMFIAIYSQLSAQKSQPSLKMNFGKGVQFTSGDSTFTLAVNGRIQSLFEGRQDLVNDVNTNDFLLRRCRLNFQGTAFSPKFTYRIQIGFAHGDITASNSSAQNNLILRDAMLFYSPYKWIKIGFGQTKLPGNRQRLVSSANLQLVERSITNNNFTLDRDKGIWFYGSFHLADMILKPTLAISSGDGRIASSANGKLCYSGRLEFLPLGEFTNGGDLIEGDNEKEKKPKLSVAGVFSYNEKSTRTMGQLGDYLYNSEVANIQYYGADLLFKYKGFSLESELYNRNSDKGVITNKKDTLQRNYVISGTGFMVQSGYLFDRTNEVAARYAQIMPSSKVSSAMHEQKEYVLGYTHYFYKHNLKLQAEVSYLEHGTAQTLIYRLNSVVTF